MQFSVSLVEILNPADSSDLAGEEQREKRVFHQRTQKIMEFKAYGVDDAPTLALNKDLDLLNVFNKLNMPSKIVLPAAKGRSGETHFLQANAEVEYFGKEFLARWVDVPVSVIQGLQDEREGEEGSSSAPPNFGGYAALRLPKGETSMGGDGLPAYDDEVLSLDDGPGKAF